MKLARHSSALAHEEILADKRLPGLHGIAAGPAHEFRNFTHFAEVECCRHIVKATKCKGDFADIRVSRALAHAIDCALDPASTGAHGGNGASRGHTEVVVSVKVHGNLRYGHGLDRKSTRLNSSHT